MNQFSSMSESEQQEKLKALAARCKKYSAAVPTAVSEIIQDAMPENKQFVSDIITRTCETHGEFTAKRLFNSIYSSCPVCNELKAMAEAERDRADKLKAKQECFNRLFSGTGIPKFYANKGFSTFNITNTNQQTALTAFSDFASDMLGRRDFGRFLVGYGSTGAGKTHLAIATALQVMRNRTVLYLLASDVIRSIRETWRNDSNKTEKQVLDDFSAVDLLIIDEIGVQFGTESEQNHLFEVINRRILDVKPTILLSNLLLDSPNEDIKTLRKYLGERTFDRLKEVGKSVRFDWESHRGVQ